MASTSRSEPAFYDVDPDDLQTPWLAQARLRYLHGVQLADARQRLAETKTDRDLDAAEAKLEKEKAESAIELKIRAKFGIYGLDKLTEGGVASAMNLQPEVEKARYSYLNAVAKAERKVTEAEHEVNVLVADVAALDDKKKLLEKAVDMLLAGFWAQPRAGRNSDKAAVGKHERDAAFRPMKDRSK